MAVLVAQVDHTVAALSAEDRATKVVQVLHVLFARPGLREAFQVFAPFLVTLWDKLVRNREQGVKVILLFIITLLCAAALGYFTTFTGGAFKSPYSQALLALALLAPQVARNKETVLAMLLIVMVVYVVYGFWPNIQEMPGDVPARLNVLTTGVTAAIALYYPLVSRGNRPPLRSKIRELMERRTES